MEKISTVDKYDTLTVAGLTLRPERDDDLGFLQRLYASTRTDEMALVNWSNDEKDHFLRSQFDAQHSFYEAQFQASRLDVIEQKGVAIGRFYVAHWSSEIRIIDISFLPAFRGHGLGGALLRALLDMAAGSDKMVSLHVEKLNPALRLYRRLGFITRGDENGIDLKMEWRSEPAD